MKPAAFIVPAAMAAAWAALASRARAKASPFSFSGKTVVITGGSRGLGLVLARHLAGEGARLALLARNQEALDRAVWELRSLGGEAFAVRCDVGDREQVRRAIRQVVERYETVEVLINNAGIIQVGPFEHMKLEEFERAMSVHLWGPLYTMLEAIPHMRRHGGGRIVNISSIGGKIAVPHLLPYSASKFALAGLSDGIREELAKDNIRVTTVAPGLMRTGSPPNALFKGRHQREFFWFALLSSLPVTSISADRAARQIIEACRRGAPELTTTWQARTAVLASTLTPGLLARAFQLYNRLLPGPTGPEGDQLKSGWESRSSLTELPLLRSTFQAAERNNERIGSPMSP